MEVMNHLNSVVGVNYSAIDTLLSIKNKSELYGLCKSHFISVVSLN